MVIKQWITKGTSMVVTYWRRSISAKFLLAAVLAASVLLSVLPLLSTFALKTSGTSLGFEHAQQALWATAIRIPFLSGLDVTKSYLPLPTIVTDENKHISELISNAKTDTASHLANLQSSPWDLYLAREYVNLTGMQPPPRYAQWTAYARQKKSILSTQGYLQIYRDLEPFLSLSPSQLRTSIHLLEDDPNIATISIRVGNVSVNRQSWRAQGFIDMLNPVLHFLPNMDIPVNLQDEPRVVVPYERMQEALKKATVRKRLMTTPDVLSNTFQKLLYSPSDRNSTSEIEWIQKGHQSQLEFIKSTCSPESKIQHGESPYPMPGQLEPYLLSSEIDQLCERPYLHDIHGPLFSPSSSSVTTNLIPIFSECKFGFNSDIMFPASMYYIADKEDPRYASVEDDTWTSKSSTIFWAGVNSGGSQQPDRVQKEVRHRLVNLFDSSLPLESVMNLSMAIDSDFISSVRNDSSVGFSSLINCNDEECVFLEHHYKMIQPVEMEQYLNHKHLIDVDGQSFSGRFRAFQFSNALTLKQTLYKEWWQDRFLPWVHYVPIKTSFTDLFPILKYMTSHDYESQKIAARGRRDAKRWFRKEDMEVYLYRLLLEYARLLDDTQ